MTKEFEKGLKDLADERKLFLSNMFKDMHNQIKTNVADNTTRNQAMSDFIDMNNEINAWEYDAAQTITQNAHGKEDYILDMLNIVAHRMMDFRTQVVNFARDIIHTETDVLALRSIFLAGFLQLSVDYFD